MDAEEARLLLGKGEKRGNAAVCLISTGDRYLIWQRKTQGYPYHKMVDSLCLFGGNKESSDATARDTLLRELKEELPASWIPDIEASLKPFARYVVHAPEDLMTPKAFSMSFIACAFHAKLDAEKISKAGAVLEGNLEIFDMSLLDKQKFCWGYDTILSDYLAHDAEGKAIGVSIPPMRCDYERCLITRIASGVKLDDNWCDDGESW